ncbi:unnamed protein product [Lactuca saligna]|uniref:Ubiquitin-like protease family profile domain-containing protein n=1 Tax=Lactuca saligna TaxID=75948 RepID=A0AA35VQJ5_LACSI|nr:unnamed protein product [Lactuca saligna]
MFEWKKQFENIDKFRLKQLKNELVQTSATDDNFRINFLVLFISTFYESTSMCKCNLNPLYLIRRDTDLSSIDWCDYIMDCLVRTKKVYNPEKESSFFYGPAAYLMVQKIRFLEDILQESGGFGCGHVNEAYVEEEFQESEYNEEESSGDEVESDVEEDLCDEDEEDFDVNKVSDVEMEDLKKDLVVKIDEEVLKFPQSQVLKNWKLLFPVEDLSTESFDFRYVSQKYKEPILTPDYDQGKCFGGQGDGSGPHEGNIGKNHVEGKGDYDEYDEQGSGSGCNKEEDMNLNFVVENVTKSVGLIDSQEGVSFSQFICDLVVEIFLKTLDQGRHNLTGIDDGTVNLGEDDHKNKVISDRSVDKIIVVKKDGEGEDVEDCSNKNKDGENVEDCANKNNDSNKTRSLKNDLVQSFSLGFSQDSEDVIDASPVSFAPPLGTFEGPSKLVSCKHKDIKEEATSVVDVKGKRQMKFSYVYKSPFKERLIDFKTCLTQVENVVCEWLFSLQGNLGVLDSWSRILNHEEKFRDIVNSPLRLFMNFDTTLLFEYTHLNESGKYKVFKERFSRSVCGDRDLKVLKDVDMVFFPVLRHEHIYLIAINLKKRAFKVINNGADDADFDDKYGAVFKPLKKSFLKYLKEIGHVKANEMADKSITPVRLTMPWRIIYNKVDCGVFAMRHMESYFGEKAEILTSEINTKRDDVLKAAYEYQKVDQKIRGKHAYDAQWNIERRSLLDVFEVEECCSFKEYFFLMNNISLHQICSKDLLGSMEIIFLSNGGRLLGVSYNLYENLARNMKNKNLGKWGT